MEILILFGVFTLLMLIGTPIAFCLGVASFATVLYMGLPPLVVFQRLNSGMSVFSLLAIPFFIYAGDLMVRGGIAQKIVAFAASLVGHIRGGLGQVNIVTATLFGGISGSAVAEAAAVGGLMIPQMKARGYGADYAVNVTSMAALIALLLPPSHNMIIYSISAGGKISIADLFTAGIIPGLLYAAALMVTAYFVARSRGYPTEAFPGFQAVGRFLVISLPGLLLIAIIFGGVRSGVFTATESSCIAVLYALAVTMFVYRQMSWNDFKHATFGAVRTTAMVLLIIGMAGAFSWLMAFLKGAGVAGRLDEHDLGEPDHHPAADQRVDAGARHLHGHGADDHHLHADLPAGGDRLRHRSGTFRRHHDPELRHRAEHAAGGGGAVRRLRGRQDQRLGIDALDLAVLRCRARGARARHLHPGAVAVAAQRVQIGDGQWPMPPPTPASNASRSSPSAWWRRCASQVLSGEIAPGQKLPTENQLTETFGVSRTVIREAIATLAADGLVEPRQGAGVFVREHPTLAFGSISLEIGNKISPGDQRARSAHGHRDRERGARGTRAATARRRRRSRRRSSSSSACSSWASRPARPISPFTARSRRRPTIRSMSRYSTRSATGPFRATSTRPGIPSRVLSREYQKACSANICLILNAISAGDPQAARDAMRAHLIGQPERYRRG